MITHVFYIHQHDWLVKAYINSDDSDADLILGDLLSVGADMDTMRDAFRNLREWKVNTGLTYTSPWNRTTIMVVSKTTSAKEFFNTLVHEMCHAQIHICKYQGIDLESEEAAYFIGGLARDMFPPVRHLLCESCRNKITECHCGH